MHNSVSIIRFFGRSFRRAINNLFSLSHDQRSHNINHHSFTHHSRRIVCQRAGCDQASTNGRLAAQQSARNGLSLQF